MIYSSRNLAYTQNPSYNYKKDFVAFGLLAADFGKFFYKQELFRYIRFNFYQCHISPEIVADGITFVKK